MWLSYYGSSRVTTASGVQRRARRSVDDGEAGGGAGRGGEPESVRPDEVGRLYTIILVTYCSNFWRDSPKIRVNSSKSA